MPEDKEKKLTLTIDEDLHRSARIKIAEVGTSFQAVLVALLTEWTFAEGAEQRKVLESRGTSSALDGLPKDGRKLLGDVAALIRRDRMAFRTLRHLVDRL